MGLRDPPVGQRCKTERLRTSILAKPFCGELVPQDPDDEFAATLLEYIRTESTNSPDLLGTSTRSCLSKHLA